MWKLAKTDFKKRKLRNSGSIFVKLGTRQRDIARLAKETTQLYFKRLIRCRDIDENCMLFLLRQPVAYKQSRDAFLLRCD